MKKTLLVVLALVLVAALSVGLTLAFLQDETEVVTNTFTVGNVTIDLDEAKVDAYGVEIENADRVKANEYKLIPNQEYVKDPTIHIVKGSEPCYVFVKVENGIAGLEPEEGSIAAQMADNGWENLSGDVYYKAAAVDARGAAVDVEVFGYFRIKGDANVADYNGKTITVKGYAVQAAGFANAEAAWAETFGKN